MLVEAALRKRPPRTERPGGPVGCRSVLASPLVSRPQCQSRATAPNRTHAHPDRDARASGSRRADALLGAHGDPRAGGAWAERDGDRRTSHGMRAQQRKEAVMDTKKAGRAAPPGESLFSSLFNVAARGGKSPRVSVVRSVYGGSSAASSPATRYVARATAEIRVAARAPCPRSSRDWRTSSRGRCSVRRPSVPNADVSHRSPHACLAGDPGQAYIFAHRRHSVIPCPTTHSLYSITR